MSNPVPTRSDRFREAAHKFGKALASDKQEEIEVAAKEFATVSWNLAPNIIDALNLAERRAKILERG